MENRFGLPENGNGKLEKPNSTLNAPDLSIPAVEGAAKVRFKGQRCREAKKFAEH